MRRQSASRSTAKFVAVTDSESIANVKRNYLTWIISVTILFGVTVGFLCYKVFLAPVYFENTHLPNDDNDSFVTTTPIDSIPELLLPEMPFRKGNSIEQSEFLCYQDQPKVETIPLRVKNTIQEPPENIYDHIHTDLVLHYENLMNDSNTENLKRIFNKYQMKLSDAKHPNDFVNFLESLMSNRLKFYARYLKKHKFEIKLESFYWFFALTEELNQWYNYLNRLRSFLSEYEQQKRKKIYEKITDVNFVTFTVETQRKIFRFVYPFSITEKKLIEINGIVNEWTKPTHVEYSNCSVTLFNRAVLLSEVNDYLGALNETCVKNVNVFASRILYVDDNMELFGVNLAIISPDWRFLKKIKINLDGVPGKEYIEQTANAGEAGKPGNPGGNGGDFLGVGGFEEKLFSISVNGGIGGRGQNGAKGRDGMNNTFPYPPIDKPECVKRVKTLEDMFPRNVTYYEIYNEAGCGSSGTDGGVGGIGGHGGVITLMKGSWLKNEKGLNGASGPFGKGGPGGIGGQNGCYYEAVDENDEFLHPVTTIKCSAQKVFPSGKSGKDNYNNQNQFIPTPKKNLSVYNSLHEYIRLTGEHFIQYNDHHIILLLKGLNVFKEAELDDVLKLFELIEKINRFEYYEFFKEKIFEGFPSAKNNTRLVNFLKSIVLGKMTYLKKNVNYFFLDMKNYLNILQAGIKSTDENSKNLQAVSHFKRKVLIKMNKIKENLKLIKEKVKAVNVLVDSEYYPEENKVSCVLLIIIDGINVLMEQSESVKLLNINEALKKCSLTEPVSKITSENQNGTKLLPGKNNLTIIEQLLRRVLMQFSSFNKNSEAIKNLSELKNVLNILRESNTAFEEKYNLLTLLIVELEHFIALYDFVVWKDLEDLFSRSLEDLTASGSINSTHNAEIELMKAKLLDVMIAVQFKLAEDASWQNVYPFYKANFFRGKTLSDFLTQLNLVRDSRDQSPFCKNYIKAVFERNSTVGEFFSWPNAVIKNKLKLLFSGAEINLESDLINRHVLDKSLLQFASLKLDFDCPGRESDCEKLRKILLNFKIDLTHSGYSFYNWKDEIFTVVSEKMTLSYNFKTWGKDEPEIYNVFFKKCQTGEIKLSPFTSWTVRLFGINEKADFNMLTPFVDIVELNLIGSGTFTF